MLRNIIRWIFCFIVTIFLGDNSVLYVDFRVALLPLLLVRLVAAIMLYRFFLSYHHLPAWFLDQNLEPKWLFSATLHSATPASLSYSKSSYSTLSYATQSYSTFSYSTLSFATLSYSTFSYSTLSYATLSYSTFRYTLLWATSYAILSYSMKRNLAMELACISRSWQFQLATALQKRAQPQSWAPCPSLTRVDHWSINAYHLHD